MFDGMKEINPQPNNGFNKLIAAPEVIEGKGLFYSSDTWQLGLLLYFLYTGEQESKIDFSKVQPLMKQEAYDIL